MKNECRFCVCEATSSGERGKEVTWELREIRPRCECQSRVLTVASDRGGKGGDTIGVFQGEGDIASAYTYTYTPLLRLCSGNRSSARTHHNTTSHREYSQVLLRSRSESSPNSPVKSSPRLTDIDVASKSRSRGVGSRVEKSNQPICRGCREGGNEIKERERE